MRVEYESTLEGSMRAHYRAATVYAGAYRTPITIFYIIAFSMLVAASLFRGTVGNVLVTFGAGMVIGSLATSIIATRCYKPRMRELIIDSRGTDGDLPFAIEIDHNAIQIWECDVYSKLPIDLVTKVNETDLDIEIWIKGGRLVIIDKNALNAPDVAQSFLEHARHCTSTVEPPPLRDR